jgi:deoxyadenosine/deoxycytidine kinase
MFFLFQRAQQMRDLAQQDLFQSLVVGDFLLDKDALFARLTLAPDELRCTSNCTRTWPRRRPRRTSSSTCRRSPRR